MNITPPIAEKKPVVRTIHDDSVVDNYFWMVDFFKKGPDSDKVIDYLKKENNYTDSVMESTKDLQSNLYDEMKARIKEKDESVPVFDNGYYYYSRTEEGKEYCKYCRKKGNLNASEEVLLDVDKMAEGKSYYDVGDYEVSEDNKLIAFSVDEVSRREYTIYVKNLETGEILEDVITGTDGNPVWANDNKTLFYTSKNPETLLSQEIKRHTLETNSNEDIVVYKEEDKSNYIGVYKSKNSKYIIIYSSATMDSEYRLLDASNPNGSFEVFQPRMKDVIYAVTATDSGFLIHTNWNAKNFRLMECSFNNTDSTSWREIVPNRSDVLLEGVDEFKDFLVLTERCNGLTQIKIKNITKGEEYLLPFSEPTYTVNTSNNPDYNSTILRYTYASFITPKSVISFNMETQESNVLKQQEVMGGYNPTDYVSEYLFVNVDKEVKVPISIVYKKGFEKNGKAPLLLYGYGSYGLSMDVNFSSGRLSLLNRGFVFAIAHIRGGQEMGRQWYDDGKLMKKMNTFTDFIDCAKFLVSEKFTSPEHLYAEGGSAGGLLMGAIANLAPKLFKGLLVSVPFVDVVNTMLDESIPLTTNEFDEWGNPKNKDAYFYMKDYSPYENIEKKNYPNMLVTTGLHDSQVQYFEPAKWVAKLRDNKTDDNLLLLHTNMEFGHSGASGRFDYLKDIALEYAFLLSLEKQNT